MTYEKVNPDKLHEKLYTVGSTARLSTVKEWLDD